MDVRLVVDADTGAIGPLISKSSTSGCSAEERLVDGGVVLGVGAVGGGKTGLGFGFDDDAGAAAADTRVALADCGGNAGGGTDFLGGAGRDFAC